MSAGRGMPLLSGPPPPPPDNVNEQSCRKCNKEFNFVFTRSRRCNHCGYAYCHSCSDFQALMPRSGNEAGYDPLPVCAFCIENLTITAGGKTYLKSLPLSRLKKYANAYSIKVNGVLEKDELIDTLIAARGPNGCLPPANESYYRRHSVPNRTNERPRGMFARAMDAMSGDFQPTPNQSTRPQPQYPSYQPRQRTTSHPAFARPDLDPHNQSRSSGQGYPPRPPPSQTRPSPQQRGYPGQGQGAYNRYAPPPGPPPSTNQHSRPNSGYSPFVNTSTPTPNQSTRPRSASAPRTPTSTRPNSPPNPPPIPSLDELLEMPRENISSLSIGSLKGILFRNHVNARLVVEKSELVDKVERLVEDERKEREDSRRREEEEERMFEEMRRVAEERNNEERTEAPVHTEGAESNQDETTTAGDAEATDSGTSNAEPGTSSTNPSTSNSHPGPDTPPNSKVQTPKMTPKAQAMASQLERTGLCVICQDEEANIAIVDCGHLCMCRACSDLIMSSTRECPLCRTRIVTEARLLRIFKS
ncbi:RING-FYVE domain-containing E3 ubiquitin-protein ligase [Abortiporus biennis]